MHWRRKWQPTPVFLPGESPWTEEPGGLQSMESQRVGRDWATKQTFIIMGLNTLCPPSPGSFWKQVSLSCLGGACYWHLVGRDPASSQHPKMPGQPHEKASCNISINHVDETPCFRNFSFYNNPSVGPFDLYEKSADIVRLGNLYQQVSYLLFWWDGKVKSLSHVLTLCDPMDCSPPGLSIHGIFQARVLEWIAISFSRGSSWPRDRTRPCLPHCRQTLYHLSHLGSPMRWMKTDDGMKEEE